MNIDQFLKDHSLSVVANKVRKDGEVVARVVNNEWELTEAGKQLKPAEKPAKKAPAKKSAKKTSAKSE